MDDDDARMLLDDSELALRRWYSSVTPARDPGLILTSGSGPSPESMRRAFDEWFLRRRTQFQTLICGQLGYAKLSNDNKTAAKTALVAIIGGALAGTTWAGQADPMATAAIVVSTQALNGLCSGYSQE